MTEKTFFEQFILENLYNLWKEHGTSKVKPLQALIEEYGFKEKNIRRACCINPNIFTKGNERQRGM